MFKAMLLFIRSALAVFCLSLLAGGCQSSDRPSSEPRGSATVTDRVDEDLLARAFHHRIITLDSHAGFSGDPFRSCGETNRQVDFPKMRAGDLDVVFFTVFAHQRERTGEGYAEAKRQAMDVFRGIRDVVEHCRDEVDLAYTPADVERIVGSGKLCVVIGIENGYVIGRDLSLLEAYRDLGGAYLGLTHDGHNDIADSAIPSEELGDSPIEHGGVSVFGERVIAELNRLGVMVDVSHLSKAATLDAIRVSPALYTTPDELERLVAAVRTVARRGLPGE